MNEYFKEWLKSELEKREWSQHELCRRAGVSQALTSLIFSGRRSVTFDYCASVARAFGYSPVKVFLVAGLLDKEEISRAA